MFDLVSKYKPSGDQPSAIEKLVKGINEGKKEQVLLGATGTGKTFTIANVIKEHIIKHLLGNSTVNLKNYFQIIMYVILFHIMIITNQRLMFHQQIHILKKIHR